MAYSIGDVHSPRVKGIVVLSKSCGDAEEEDPCIVSLPLSDGVVCTWYVQMVKEEKTSPLAEAHTRSRLTCLAGSSIKCTT